LTPSKWAGDKINLKKFFIAKERKVRGMIFFLQRTNFFSSLFISSTSFEIRG